MKSTIIIIFVAIAALAGGIIVQINNKSPEIQTVSLATISLPNLIGEMQSLSKWQGKTLIINFWATWCPPCLKEIPDFMALQDEFKGKNIQFIGIALEDQQTVANYQAKMKINYPLLIGEISGTQIARSWGNVLNTVPFTVIINPQGEIIHRQMGEFSKQQILSVIQPSK
jgi:thiol-disulfide isomerase/thioredoxin